MSTWTQAFGNPRRTSAVTEGPTSTNLSCQWYTTFEPYIHPYVQPIADMAGDVYIATSAGLHKVNGANGAVVWSYPGRYACTPAYGNDSIYAALTDGRIVSLNAATGAERWAWRGAQAGFDADVLLSADGSKVVVGCRDGRVYCLNAATGAQAWQYPAPGDAPIGPMDAGAAEHAGSVYVLSNDMHLRKFALATGALQGTSPKLLGEAFRWFPPVLDAVGGLIFIPTGAPLYKKGWGGFTWRSKDFEDFWGKAPHGPILCGIETVDGVDVYDFSVKGDALYSVAEFIEKNPERVAVQVLNLGDLTEYRLAAHNGIRAPFMSTDTYSGNRFACAVADDGTLYINNWRADQAVTPSNAAIYRWQKGTTKFDFMGISPANDEPMWFSLGAGGLLHAALTSCRTALSVDPQVRVSKSHWGYTDDGSGLGQIAPGWNAHFIPSIECPVGTTFSGDGANLNGAYGNHQFTALPIPAGDKLYMITGNTLTCWAAKSATAVRSPNVKPVVHAPQVAIADPVQRLEAALAFVNTDEVQHLRPALVTHVNPELNLSHNTFWLVGYTTYGRWISETLIPLLRAYPHVTARLQEKIRDYVKAEWAAWGPPAGYSRLPEVGEGHVAREWCNQSGSNIRSDLTPSNYAGYIEEGFGDEYPWRTMPLHWYCAWQMCATLLPDAGIDPAALYATLRNDYVKDYQSLQNHTRDALFIQRPFALNAHLSGLYGRWQLALLAGATTEAAEAKQLLDDYAAFWNTNFSKDLPADWAKTWGTYETTNLRGVLVARWWLWLVPEVAELIKADAGYNQAKIDAALAEMQLNAPFWDLRYFPGPIGESQTHPLYDYEALFNAKQLFQDAGQAELAPHLDAPVFAVGDYQYINALVTYLEAAEPTPPPPPAPLEISALRVLTPGEVKMYEQFEVAFDITGSRATRPDWPYDPNAPAGIEAKTGITVNAEILGPGETDWNKATALPCFSYQPVKTVEGRLTPTGATEWRWRFSPPRPGEWRYRVRATDAGGSAGSQEGIFTVSASDAAGYVKLSSDGFFVTRDGAPFTDPLVNIGGGYWPFGKADEIRANLAKLADAGVRFIRWFPTGESGSNIIPFGDDIVSSWGFGNAYVTRDELDAGKAWSFVPYFYSHQRIALEVNKAYTLQCRVKITGSRQLVIKVVSDGGRVLASQTLHGPLGWTTQKLFFNSDNIRNAIIWLVNGVSETDATEGKPYLSAIALYGDDGKTTGPNLLSRANPDTHTYVDAVSAAYLDLVLEESAARGIYHKLTLFHKNDALLARLQSDGAWGEHDVNHFYAGNGQAARWLELAYVRYFLARWGSSSNLHSLELANENMLSEASYDAAFAVAEYIKVHQPRPIMQSNSFWGWYVDAFWNDPKRRDLMDYADKHWYESTEPDNFNGELVGADWADSAASVRKAYRRFLQYEAAYRPGQPIVRGETGVNGPNGEHPALADDKDGVYLHKMLWANVGCGRHNVAGEWSANLIDKNNLWRHFGAYRNFMAAERGSRADYTDIGTDLTGDAAILLEMQVGALRAWGQRHKTNNSFLLWIDNPSQTWYNVVQGATVIPASGTATVQNLEPGRYQVQRWNTNDGTVLDTSEIAVTATRQLAFRVTGLTSDVGFKVSRLGDAPPPVVTPPPVTPWLPIETIRAVAWRALYPTGGLKVDPKSPLSLAAAQLNLGLPTTNETIYRDWVVQGFAGGILNAIPDKWDDIRLVTW